MGKGKRHDTLAGEAFLRQDGAVEEAPRLGLVTCGEDLARLLDGAMACNFSHEAPQRDEADSEEDALVARFLRDCVEFCDVPGLPEPLREEMEEYFGHELDALWRRDWLVFGAAEETVLEPGDEPLTGRAVTLCLARADSPSVEMDARLRRSLEYFKEAMARVTRPPPDDEDGPGGLIH
ncbi:hypothetical protein [Melittangium boletus]|uniref:Uncharacterized protein n=1 Tax=Melittangium boletus DSM 14713 TaxID=1294270 RepID=A0A250IEN0_9BACT|nr:hypothetical protein [Melittangium boletus]ATB29680.1 hypothetical protein MEBOL_003135 [Melittangium boletus DSM 14713]